jgi:hypothetical protein
MSPTSEVEGMTLDLLNARMVSFIGSQLGIMNGISQSTLCLSEKG